MDTIKKVLWNTNQERPRATWRVAAFAVAWLAVLFAALALAHVLLSGLDEVYATPLTTLLHLLLFGVLVLRLLGARLLDRRPLADYGLHLGRGWWLDLGAGAAPATLLLGGIFAVELAMGWIHVSDTVVTATPTEPPLVASPRRRRATSPSPWRSSPAWSVWPLGRWWRS